MGLVCHFEFQNGCHSLSYIAKTWNKNEASTYICDTSESINTTSVLVINEVRPTFPLISCQDQSTGFKDSGILLSYGFLDYFSCIDLGIICALKVFKDTLSQKIGRRKLF